MTRKGAATLTAILLVGLVAGIYYQVHWHEFVNFDTNIYVVDNPLVSGGLTWGGIRWAFRLQAYAANWHPLTWLSHMLDCQLFGLDYPGGHKLVSVLLHAVNAVLLMVLVRRLTGPHSRLARVGGSRGAAPGGLSADPVNLWIAGLTAALFAAHPLRVESVAWVAERKDVLSALFWLLALLAYTSWVERRTWWRYGLVMIWLTLGLLSKPMVVTLPCVLLLLDYWPLGRLTESPQGSRRQNRAARKLRADEDEPRGLAGRWTRLVVEKLPLFVLVAVSCVLTYWAQQRGGAMRDFETVPLVDRAVNGTIAYWLYLEKTFWPVPLACFYPHPGRDLLSRPEIVLQLAWSVAVLIGITALAVWQARRRPYLIVGWFWYLGTLVPVIGIVLVGGAQLADRFTYIPHMGLWLALVWGAADLLSRWPVVRRAAAGACVLLVAAAAAWSWKQVPNWRNTTVLFEHALAVTERNFVAYATLGAERLNQGDVAGGLDYCRRAFDINSIPYTEVPLARALLEAKQYDEAEAHLLAVQQTKPDDWSVNSLLALCYEETGRLEESAAAFQRALRSRGWIADLYHRLGNVLLMLEHEETAIRAYRLAIALNPQSEARATLEQVTTLRAAREERIAALRRALEQRPDDEAAIAELGQRLIESGRLDDARRHFVYTLGFYPQSSAAVAGLAAVENKEGNLDAALARLDEAIRLAPQSARHQAALAELQLKRGEVEAAEAAATRTIELAPQAAVAYRVLARVRDLQGRRDEALIAYRQAHALTPSDLETVLGLGWHLATHPDPAVRNPSLALELARHGHRRQLRKTARTLDVLAAALAAAGQFDEAVGVARQAVAMARHTATDDEAAAIARRLDLYERSQPYYAW